LPSLIAAERQRPIYLTVDCPRQRNQKMTVAIYEGDEAFQTGL